MIRVWLIFALVSFSLPQSDANPEGQAVTQQRPNPSYEAHRQAAIRINELAGNVHSEAEAREFADAIANVFAAQLPPAWATRSIRHRVVGAEYEAVTNPSRQIPEQRIADVWNQYVREIGAPDEALVTAAEIHNMRDADYASGQMMWTRGIQNVWTMPMIYALGPDGKVADGCRAVEALRVIHEIAYQFDNLRGARERLQKGILASHVIKQSQEKLNSGAIKSRVRLEARVANNPIRPAESRYIREQGANRFNELLERLFNELFPAEAI
jgi:hypothetical protein